MRVDGLVLLVATVVLFAAQHQPWWLYPALVLAPDLSMVGYRRGTAVGALWYNVGHSYLAPAIVVLAGWRSASSLTVALGLIWLGHVGADRALGYGLKYDSGFADTHLGRLGSPRRERPPHRGARAGRAAPAGRKYG
ncbi:MAG: DUF4260 domain-containing protein [Acidimicrobiales bacterium]